MRVDFRCVFIAAASLVTICATRADVNEAEKKRQAEQRERVRKAEPMKADEFAAIKENDALIALLGKADSLELLRLKNHAANEEPGDRGKTFYGYPVLARTRVGQATQRAELVEALGRDLHWMSEYRAICFFPRHGLRAVVGKETVDLVICFECHQMRVYRNGQPKPTVTLLGAGWEPADRLLKDAERAGKK